MFRQSPGRSQRSKGLKVKHVLQICFLIAICFWLIYQVKHSHDKKKEFDETDAKVSVRTQSSNEIPKLGRKDLNPEVEEAATATKKQNEHTEEEEEESVGGEENKHEEMQQEEEQKFGGKEEEEEGKGVGDDELEDEHEQEKSDAEVDQEEGTVEEEKDKEEGDEKDREENDSEDNNGQLENESSLDDHDEEDGTAKSTHEAREELYRADDASSAVTHETQVGADENENEDSEKIDHSEMSKSANESPVNNTEKSNDDENTTLSNTEGREVIENNNPLSTTTTDTVANIESKSEGSSLSSNSTLSAQSNDHDHAQLVNTTEVIRVDDGLSMPNVTETQSNPSHLENVALEGKVSGDGSDMQNVSLDQGDKSTLGSSNQEGDPNLATSMKTEERDSSAEETSNPDNKTAPIISMNTSSVVADENSEASTTGSKNTIEYEKLDTDLGRGSEDNNALKTENPEEVQNDPIDSSDSSVAVRTDLETLPEIQTEVTQDEDAAVE